MNYENEIWKDIIIEKNGVVYDYTGLYEVSNYGRVRRLDRVDSSGHRIEGKIIRCKPHKNGYVYVGLRKNGEREEKFRIHRLVATAFIPNPDNLPYVNHKNELKHDNVWTNLEWCTASYNVNYGTRNERASEKMKGKLVGEKNPMYGKPHTEETRKKMSENHADISGNKNPMYGRKGEKSPRARKAICLETKQVFGSIIDASEWCRGDVKKCCQGRNKTAGGYHWQYYEDYKREQRLKSDIKNSRLAA